MGGNCTLRMKLYVFIGVMLALSGCATVHVSVNSIKNAKNISRDVPIVFPHRGDDIEIEKMRRQCAKGAQSAQIRVVNSCKGKCYFATVEGNTGGTTQKIYSDTNYYTGELEVSSSERTQRKVKISIYSDMELTKLVYQAVMDSSGSKNNVLSVAEEMCQAGFEAYPNEYSDEKFRIFGR